jgi:hypothetical protein
VAQVVGPEFKPKYHTYTQKNSALVICKLWIGIEGPVFR